MEIFCRESSFFKWLVTCVMVIVALYWGREQKLSKAWLWSDVASKSRTLIILQESAVLLALVGAMLFSMGLGLGFGSLGSQSSLLVPQDRVVVAESRGLRWVSSGVATDEILGLTVSFWEQGLMSDVTYSRIEVPGGGEVTLKANREVFLPEGVNVDFAKVIRVGGRRVELRIDKVGLYKQDGRVWSSLGIWSLRLMMEMSFLALVLIWMGKHISLEIGLVALLSSWFMLISQRFFYQGYTGQTLSTFFNPQQRSKYTERWWEELLLAWTRVWHELSHQWASLGFGADEIENLRRGVALKLGAADLGMAMILIFFVVGVSLLDYCALRCR